MNSNFLFNAVLAQSLRIPGARQLARKFPMGSVERRVALDVWPRPHYGYGVFTAAQLAKALGLPGISAVEFGVAGGRGLLALEKTASEISRAVGIRIDVYGFDAGTGMPEASDYRDLPHVWEKGYYKMDVDALKTRLTTAKLVIGDVAETVPSWITSKDLLPLGFIAFDLDYYSSTVKAFGVFDGAAQTRLPRVLCYLDDIMWPERAFHNEFTGELLAIKEFNEAHPHQKIAPINLLRNMRLNPQPWNDMMFVMHDFEHPLYCQNITPRGDAFTQKPL